MTVRELLHDRGIHVEQGTSTTLFDGRAPGIVARPTSTEQVAEIMRVATEHDLTVAARGAGTKLTWGCPGDHLDVVVDLSAMNQVLAHEPGDLIVSTQAGCPLSAVQEACGAAGQRLALDEMVPGTTVGGLIATNPSGPLRVLAGTVRDLLIGVTIVLADGTIAHAGGKVVKNVAGYDLGKLLVGSYGTLAIVTEATFRLHPVPKATQWVTATHSPDRLTQVLADLLHTQDAPSAIEVRATDSTATEVAVLLEGTAAGVEHRAGRVAALMGGAPAVAPAWTAGYPWAVGESTGLKITCQLSAVPQVLSVATAAGWDIQGSAGAGVVYATPKQSESGTASSADGVADVATRLRAAALGGSVIVLDAPRGLRTEIDIWGPIPALAVMRRVKEQFDPDHRLAPGRFVGGI